MSDFQYVLISFFFVFFFGVTFYGKTCPFVTMKLLHSDLFSPEGAKKKTCLTVFYGHQSFRYAQVFLTSYSDSMGQKKQHTSIAIHCYGITKITEVNTVIYLITKFQQQPPPKKSHCKIITSKLSQLKSWSCAQKEALFIQNIRLVSFLRPR